MRDSSSRIVGTIAVSRDITAVHKAENAYRESEERFRQIAENMELGLWLRDPHEKEVLYANRGFREIWGNRDAAGRIDLIHSDNRDQQVSRTLERSEGHEVEPETTFRIVREDGDVRWIECWTFPIRNEHGDIYRYAGTVDDITDRKNAELSTATLARENEVLAEIGQIITASLDIKEVYEPFVEQVLKLIPAEKVDIVSVDLGAGTLTVEHAFGVGVDAPSAQVGFTRGLEGSIAEQIIRRGSGIRSVAIDVSERIDESSPFFATHKLGLRSNISTPLISKGEVIGMLAFMSRSANAFTEGHLSIAERVGAQIASAIANAREYGIRVKAELALKESEEQFQQIADNVTTGLWLQDEGQAEVRYANPEFRRIWGTRDLAARLALLHPDDRERAEARTQERLSNQEVEAHSEYRIVSEDGDVHWLSAFAFPIKDNNGDIFRYAGTIDDVTGRKLAEAAVRKAEEKYRTIVENSDDPIIVIQDGKVVYRNESDIRLVGKLASESVEQRFIDFIAPEDRERVRTYYQARLRDEPAPDRYEVTRLVDDGRRMRVEVKPRIIEFDGRPATLVIQRDVTARVKAEGELRLLRRRLATAQEEERRHISQELHDEIGQELTGLKYLLASTKNTSRIQAETTLAEAIENVDRLLDEVRDLSLSLRPSMLDDLGLLPALVWLVGNNFAHSGLHVDFNHSGIGGRFDPAIEIAAYRVVQEGLTNIQRHAKTTEARLSVVASEDTVHVTVEDKGSGFESDDPLRTESTGLPGMRERVELLDGTLQITSSPGAGTTILAELPQKTAAGDGRN